MENELTLGFRITYNTDSSEMIPKKPETYEDVAKFNIAETINILDEQRSYSDSPDQKRLCSIAISKLEEACMFIIKASTYGRFNEKDQRISDLEELLTQYDPDRNETLDSNQE